jgi:UDP-N-acetyl-D-glucosamine dehydrogenase
MGDDARVAIIGLGYVGLPLAIAFEEAGLEVVGVDASETRVAELRTGSSPIDDISNERLGAALAKGLRISSPADAALTEADALFVCVPTPITDSKDPDLGPVLTAGETIAAGLRPGQLVVLQSTTFPGTTTGPFREVLERGGLVAGRDFDLAFAPERVNPGDPASASRDVPRLVGATTPAATHRAATLLRHINANVVELSSPDAAELAKLLENVFRNINIAFVNQLALLCERMGLDVWEVIDAAATKPFGFMRFTPGPGVGGHCIPCDPHYLLWQLRATQQNAPLVTQAMHAIAERPKQVVDRVVSTLSRNGKGLAGARVLVVGVTYKPGVQDVRSSSALDIIDLLAAKGAKVGYHDPLVPTIRVTGGQLDSVVEPEGDGWDVALIHTVQPGHGYDWLGQCPVVIDATYRFDPALFAN